LAALALVPSARSAPDLLVSGGPIYTGVDSAPRVEALVIRASRIAFAGSLREARRLARRAQSIDLGGAAAFPGFVDAHAHFAGIGQREMTLNLEGARSLAQMLDRVAAAARERPSGPIVGRGWIETHWPERRFPTRADLDAVVADRPVYLTRADGHASVANGAALALGGVTAASVDPAGGKILRDSSGVPDGMLIDNAQSLVERKLPAPTAADMRAAVQRADTLYASRGWTGIHNMSVGSDELDALRARAAAGELAIRVDNYVDPSAAERELRNGVWADAAGRLRIEGIKLYADGALGSRGAALFEPYSDAPDTRGLLVSVRDYVVTTLRRARDTGARVAMHAIGDRGNRLVLDWFAEALGPDLKARRWRIEHAQVLDRADIPRFAQLGVIASMQPSHAISDLYFAPARLGPQRLRGAYAWRSLLENGAVICAGSDAPVEKGDPLIEFYAATHRHSIDGFAGADWGLTEAVSRQQALRMLTWAPAYAAGRERELGTLQVGKRADVSAFSADLMTVPPPELLTARALLTVSDGRVVYRAL
jgi:hypothetical protein